VHTYTELDALFSGFGFVPFKDGGGEIEGQDMFPFTFLAEIDAYPFLS
jgi:hypothetical protein